MQRSLTAFFLFVLIGFSRLCLGQTATPPQSYLRNNSFVNWESAHVHPLDITPDGSKLLAVNTANNSLEIYSTAGGLTLSNNVPVGLDPVTVRARTNTEAWVVNVISDSVSIVDLQNGIVTKTLQANDEPADVVFAGTSQNLALVSCAQAKTLLVFNATAPTVPTATIPINGEQPRALAVDKTGRYVYLAIFESGNATTAVVGGASSFFENDLVQNPNGPYGGLGVPPNNGKVFNPPINPALPAPPVVSLIVRRTLIGGAIQWLDDNLKDWSKFISSVPAIAANAGTRVKGWDMPDRDVAIVDTTNNSVTYQSGLMNILMAIGVNPSTNEITVVGTDATNQIRYEPVVQSTFVHVNFARFTQGGANTIADLNPQLNYGVKSIPVAQRANSIGDPRSMVWSADGSLGYVTGMGSNNVAIIGPKGQRVGLINVGQGPTGLVLGGGLAYVLNKFDASISTINLSSNTVTSTTPLYFDPTPAALKAGRPLLYNTQKTSGLGQASCASCHVDARWDRLAWDLGNPAGAMVTNPGVTNSGNTVTYHPMKGPFLTMTLADTMQAPFLHWRGDRPTLENFEGAFQTLMGADNPASQTDINNLRNFLSTITLPPNPNRNLDNSYSTTVPIIGPNNTVSALGDANIGATEFESGCRSCHPGHTNRSPLFIDTNGDFGAGIRNPPTWKNFYKRQGLWFQDPAASNVGFGFQQDGTFDSTQNQSRDKNLMAFMMSFNGGYPYEPSGLNSTNWSNFAHAAVGKQVTLSPANPADATGLLTQLEALGDSGAIGLVAKGGVVTGPIRRGWMYLGNGVWQSDHLAEVDSTNALNSLVAGGATITFTAVPNESAARIGIDMDGDGILDYDDAQPNLANLLPTNLALAGTATASSIWDANHTAAQAIDGNTLGYFDQNSMLHTQGGTNDWWQEDLGTNSQVSLIQLFNRWDCCSNRLANVSVFVSQVPFVSTDVNQTRAQAGVKEFFLSGTQGLLAQVPMQTPGRYVRVQLNNTTNPLQLAEVRVMGIPIASLVSPGTQAGVVGSAVSLPVTLQNATTAYSFSAANLPPGLNINAATGLISGVISSPAASSYTTTVTASALTGGSPSATFVWNVTTPPVLFYVSAPGPVVLQAGQNGTSIVTIFPIGGFSGSVALSASGLPAGVSSSFTSQNATTSTLTISAAAAATPGTYFLTIVGRSGSSTASTPLTLVVTGDNITPGQTNVLMQHNDIGRTGQDLTETILTPKNVSSGSFGKLYSIPIDAASHSQPLYLSSLPISGVNHSVLFAETENDTVYAFDANAAGTQLWKANLADTGHGAAVGAVADQPGSTCEGKLHGVQSTPVIDPSTNTMYVVSRTLENNALIYRLHALDVTTGNEKFSGPTVISGSVAGTGNGSSGGVLTFNPMIQKQLPGLLLVNGNVYIGFGSYCDSGAYHGWLMGYNASTLSQTSIFSSSPNGSASGFWMSGSGLAADFENNAYRMFVATGNGSFDSNSDYGDSVLQLGLANGLQIGGSFTPSTQASMASLDLDLGSGGTLVLPDNLPSGVANASVPHMAVQIAKNGHVYLLNRESLGGFNASSNNVLQDLNSGNGQLLGTPAYWNGNIYYWWPTDSLRQYSLSNGQLSTSPVAVAGPSEAGDGNFEGATPSVSSNGTSNGIVWVIDNQGGGSNQYLYAFDATNVSTMLWSSAGNPVRDGAGGAGKWTPPTIADGKVFVVSNNQIAVYGLLPFVVSASPATVNLAPGGSTNTSVAITSANGFAGGVTLSASNLPAGVTVSFAAAAGANATATFSAASTAPSGTATVLLTATSGNYTQTIPLPITVGGIADFALASVTPASVSVQPGGASSTSGIAVTALGGFAGSPTLAVTGLPGGVTTALSGNMASGYGLSFNASFNAAPGVYPLTVTATSGTLVHSTTILLTVSLTSGITAVNMSTAYNVYAIFNDGSQVANGGIDGSSYAYSAHFLSGSLAWGNLPFLIGPAGMADAATSETITLPGGTFGSLNLLAAATYGSRPGQAFTVTYTDGSAVTSTQTLSDWGYPQSPAGESIISNEAYRVTPSGAQGPGPFYVYGYSIPLNSAKTVQSITLPNNSNVIALAITLSATAPSTGSQAQTVTFAPIANQTIGGSMPVSATASSGLPVAFSVIKNGACSISGNTVTFLAAGNCAIVASQSGNNSFAAAPSVAQVVTVGNPLQAQTITFAPIANQTTGNSVTLSGSATSGLPVSFAVVQNGVCNIAANTVAFVSAGSCSIIATQPGNSSFSAAPAVGQVIAVANSPQAQTITFAPIANQTAGGSVTLSASASSGLPVSFTVVQNGVCTISGNKVTFVSAGSCSITATQAGNSSFLAAPAVGQVIAVATSPQAQTITFAPIANQTAGSSVTLSASASSGLPVSFTVVQSGVCNISGNIVTFAATGSCSITAIQAGNSNFLAAPAVTINVSIIAGPSNSAFTIGQTLGALRSNYSGFVGFAMTTGSTAVSVSALGRYVAPGDAGTHTLKLVSSNGTDVPGGSVSLSLAGTTAGGFSYAPLSAALTLQPNTSYFLVSQETAGGDQWYDTAPILTTSAATVTAPVYTYGSGSYYQVPGLSGQSYVPLSFLYGPATSGLSVSIVSPQAGATMSGTNASISVATSGSITSLQLKADGVNQGSAVSAGPLTLDTTTLTNGSHTLTVVASSGTTGSAVSPGVTVTISNGVVAGAPFIVSQTASTLRNNYSGFVGTAIQVGARPLSVTSLGRYFVSGNSGTHTLKLVQANGTDVAGGSASVNMTGGTVGQFVYATLTSPVALLANTTYYVVSQESAGGDMWYDLEPVTGTTAAQIIGATYADGHGNFSVVTVLPGYSYVPVNFQYQ